MASRLSPNRSLGRLARTVKNIWTKSEMRRTSQPGSMIKCGAVAFASAIRASGQVRRGGSADLCEICRCPAPRGDRINSWCTSQSYNATRAANARTGLRTPLSSAAR